MTRSMRGDEARPVSLPRGAHAGAPDGYEPVAMVQTEFLGPTDRLGSRIKAWSVGAGKRPGFQLSLECEDALGIDANHLRAALELRRRIYASGSDPRPLPPAKVVGSGIDGGGFVFAFLEVV